MQEFLKFIQEYKELIISASCLLCTILCIVLKRKPSTIDDFKFGIESVIDSLPALINEVECPGNGAKKKAKVINSAVFLLSKVLKRSLTESEVESASDIFAKNIEAILSTPQKKD